MTTWFAPGRVEVLGKHTDYAGGQSLLAALDRGVTVTVRDAAAGVTARSDAVAGTVALAGSAPLPEGHWGRYLQSVRSRLERNFGPLPPCAIEVSSTLPLASGMSSSSALVVAAALALARHNGFDRDPRWVEAIRSPEDLATYLACFENGAPFAGLEGDGGVGTFGGSEDHTAMICCREGHLARYSFAPTVPVAQVPFPDGLTFVVAVSGVLAEKTGAAREAYNRSSLQAREIVRRWNGASGRSDATLAQALRSAPDAGERLAELVSASPALRRRLAHFVTESEELVPAAAAALASGDLGAFGAASEASQRRAEEWLGNQVPQTRHLAASARALGAPAASSFGAGYGGSVWALVPSAEASGFAERWLDDYSAAFPGHTDASAVIGRPSGPAGPRPDPE